MAITEIASIFTSVKAATDIAKFVRDSDFSLEKAEGKLKLAELVSALADVKLQAVDIQQALTDRDEKIRGLEAALKLRSDLVWREPCYWLATAEGIEEPYCQSCYDSISKLSRLHSPSDGRYICRVCDKAYMTRERLAEDAAKLKAQNARRVVARPMDSRW
jgi:hypothetical protein